VGADKLNVKSVKKENALVPAGTPKSNSQRDRLLSFYLGHDVVLDSEEEELRIRVEEVHKLLRSWSHKREEIIDMMVARFKGISRYRAERDIAACHFIFGKSYQINPSFVVAQLIEEIQESIRQAKASKNAKERMMLPKFYDNLTKAIQQIPAETQSPNTSKKVVIYNIHGNKEYQPGMTFSDAIARLKQKHAGKVEDIDHEDLP
jgi:hypothetical protein